MALLIGLLPSVAIIPCVSRSAASIVGGSLIGISKRTIVEFSFMLAVPTMLAASGLELLKNHSALAGPVGGPAVGLVVRFITAHVPNQAFPGVLEKARVTAIGLYPILVPVAVLPLFLREPGLL